MNETESVERLREALGAMAGTVRTSPDAYERALRDWRRRERRRRLTGLAVAAVLLAAADGVGLWALNRIKAACAKHGVTAAIVAGPEVERVLRICDPAGALGLVATLDRAVSIVLDRSSANSR